MKAILPILLGLLDFLSMTPKARMKGSGVAISQDRQLQPFAEVVVTDTLHVEITGGDSPRLVVSGDDNLVPLVQTEVQKQRLLLSMKDHAQFLAKSKLVVLITVPLLRKLQATAASNIVMRGVGFKDLHVEADGASRIVLADLNGARVRSNLFGASQLTLSGQLTSLDATLGGASTLAAREASSEMVTVSGDGASNIAVCAKRRFELLLTGASHADCYCDPAQVHQEVTGASSVSIRQER